MPFLGSAIFIGRMAFKIYLTFVCTFSHIISIAQLACPSGAIGSVAARCLATVIGESGFEAQAGRIIVSGYSGVCFEIKFSGRHRGFDVVLFNM